MKGIAVAALLAWRRLRYRPPWASLCAVVVLAVTLLLVGGVAGGLRQRVDRRAERVQSGAVENEYYLAEGRLRIIIPFEDVGQAGSNGPASRDMLVSPALARLLDSDPTGAVAARLPYTSRGLLPTDRLAHPDEIVAVVGGRAAPRGWDEEIGGPSLLGVVLLGSVTLVPLTVLLSTALRVDARQREGRHQLLKLLGAAGTVNAFTGITETLAIAVVAFVVAAPIYLAITPLTAKVPIAGAGFFAGDLLPGPVAVAAIVTVVLLTCVGVALHTHRRGVTRKRPAAAPPHALPRLLLSGVALMVAATAASEVIPEVALAALEAVALLLAIVGVAREGPALVRGLAATLLRSRRRSVAGVVALRRMESDPAAAYRAVTGLALVCFVVGYVSPLALGADGADTVSSATRLEVGLGESDPRAVVQAVGDIEGTTMVASAPTGAMQPEGQVTTCEGAREMLSDPLPDCAAGIAYLRAPTGPSIKVVATGTAHYADPTVRTQQFSTRDAPITPASDPNAAEERPTNYVAVVDDDEIAEWPLTTLRFIVEPSRRNEVIRAVAVVAPEALIGSSVEIYGTTSSNASLQFALNGLGLFAAVLMVSSLLIVVSETQAQRREAGAALYALGADGLFRRREQMWRFALPLLVATPLSFLSGTAMSLTAVWLLEGDGATPWPQLGAMLVGYFLLCLFAIAVSEVVAGRQDPMPTLRRGG